MKESKSVAPGAQKEETYVFKLFIAEGEHNSRLASENLKSICDEYLKGRYQIEEVDVLTNFASALKDRIFVTPVLILVAPKPQATVVGNLANKERVVAALRLGRISSNGT